MMQFNDKERREIISKIQFFFKKECEKDMGIIMTEKVLDFFMDELGKKVYNKALDDSKRWMKNHLENLEVDFDQNYN